MSVCLTFIKFIKSDIILYCIEKGESARELCSTHLHHLLEKYIGKFIQKVADMIQKKNICNLSTLSAQ